jgi:hypothetical protein
VRKPLVLVLKRVPSWNFIQERWPIMKTSKLLTVLLAATMLAPPLSRPGHRPGRLPREARMEFASGTLTWLFRNGLVTGELDETSNPSLIFGAQLSARSYETFIRPDGHDNSRPLGQLAISALSQPGTKEESTVAELVARRLLKG